MACKAAVIAHSENPVGGRIATLQLRYWRAIHGELMTHRVFSRNASSSRAIPVKEMLKQVWSDPAGPIHWGANQAGMQARKEIYGIRRTLAKFLWFKVANRLMCLVAWLMMQLGLHKQVANRLLEPWQFINVVVTSTEWENFFGLRDHPDAQPEIRQLAHAMRLALSVSTPVKLKEGDWHTPFVSKQVREKIGIIAAITQSVARCARTSYMTFKRRPSELPEDKKLHDFLVEATPPHMSPAEHQARALGTNDWCKNFRGWQQYRSVLELGDGL